MRAALHGREVAEALQLSPEYDPQPLAGGTPAMARPEVLAAVQARLRERLQRGAAEIEAIAARLAPVRPTTTFYALPKQIDLPLDLPPVLN